MGRRMKPYQARVEDWDKDRDARLRDARQEARKLRRAWYRGAPDLVVGDRIRAREAAQRKRMELIREVRHLYEDKKLSSLQVAEKMGLTQQRVHDLMKAGGIKARSRHETFMLATARISIVPRRPRPRD